MRKALRKLFTKNIGLKITALILALGTWFYIVNELNKGSEEERRLLNRVLTQDSLVAKNLSIKPIFVGRLKSGYSIDRRKLVIVPDHCIVVGNKDLLGKIRFTYTSPIDLTGAYKTFTKSVPLDPIAPGV